MSKRGSIIRLVLSLTVISLLLCGCVEKDNPTGPIDSEMVGTWNLTKYTIIAAQTTLFDAAKLNEMGSYWKLELKDNSTFASDYSLEENEVTTGTWSESGDNLILKYDSGETSTFKGSVAGNLLTLEWTTTNVAEEESFIAEFTKE